MAIHREQVDMVSEARDAQWNADTFLGIGSLRLIAPAKVNLLLAVGNKRADSYHEVVTILHALALHDTLYLHLSPLAEPPTEEELAKDPEHMTIAGPSDNLLMYIDMADKINGGGVSLAASDNLITQAIDSFTRLVGFGRPARCALRVDKNIPTQGGLGGGSSDAAAVLLGLAKLLSVDESDPRLEQCAQSLGADVAFFLHGGCALFDGTGDHFVCSLTPRTHTLLLVKPDQGADTAAVYQAFDEAASVVSAELTQKAYGLKAAAEVSLINNLTEAARQVAPAIGAVQDWLLAQKGVSDVLLCGSGSTSFALIDDLSLAYRLSAEAQRKGWWSRVSSFSPLGAAVFPQDDDANTSFSGSQKSKARS